MSLRAQKPIAIAGIAPVAGKLSLASLNHWSTPKHESGTSPHHDDDSITGSAYLR
jgi:hypothetical protein